LIAFSFVVSVSAVNINPVTMEPLTYYTDSSLVELKLNLNELHTNVDYNFSYNATPFLSFYTKTECDRSEDVGCTVYLDKNFIGIGSTVTSGWVSVIFKLNSPSDRLFDIFTYDLLLENETDINGPLTKTFSPLSGKPTFDVELIDMNSDESSTEFPKNHRAQVVVKNLNDNEDDIGGEYVKCVYNVVGKSITGQVVGTTPATEINLGSFDMTNLGSAGTYTLNVKCYDRTDNAYFGEENVEFSFLDQQPTATLSFTPETVYPDTSVSCSATGSDVDDPDYIFSFAYSWLLGSTEKSDVNVLNCSTARL